MTVPGVYSPEQGAKLQAHVDKVIASDGVDYSRAVEVMARAIAVYMGDDINREGPWLEWYKESRYYGCARAALGALRALEGE